MAHSGISHHLWFFWCAFLIFKTAQIGVNCLRLLLVDDSTSGGGDVLTLLLPHGGWFLPFYCVLLIVSPILNAALENDKNRKMILFSAMLLMIAGWVPTFTTDPHIGMMRVPGMQGNGLMMMVALYIFGFFVNQYRVAQKAAYVVWAVAFLIGITACYCMGRLCPTACHYASPVSAVTAIAGFCLFMTLPRIRGRSAKIVNFIAPSMFSVYLIHECCIKQYQYLPHQSDVSDAFVRAVVLFVVSIAIDLMRRAIFAGLYRVNVRIRQKLW